MPLAINKKQQGSSHIGAIMLMLVCIGGAMFLGFKLKNETEAVSAGSAYVSEYAQALIKLSSIQGVPQDGEYADIMESVSGFETKQNHFIGNLQMFVGKGIEPLDRVYQTVLNEKDGITVAAKDMGAALTEYREATEDSSYIEDALNDYVKASETFIYALVSLNNVPSNDVQELNSAVMKLSREVDRSLGSGGMSPGLDKAWGKFSDVIQRVNAKISRGLIPKKSTVSKGLNLTANTANKLRSHFGTLRAAEAGRIKVVSKANDVRTIASPLLSQINTFNNTTKGRFGYTVNIEIVGLLMLLVAGLAIVVGFLTKQSTKGIADTMEMKARSAGEGSAQKTRAVQSVIDSISLIREGDLTVRLQEDDPFTKDIASAVNSLVKTIGSIMSEVKVMSSELHSASAQSAQTASNVERSREQQDHAINNAYQMTQDLHFAIEAIEQSAQITSSSVEDSIRSVKLGSAAIVETNEAVKLISGNNQQIANRLKSMMDSVQGLNRVVDLISDVLSQTRMLSMNLSLLSQDMDEKTSKRINYTATTMNEFVNTTDESLRNISVVVSTVVGEASEMQKSVEGSTTMTTDLLSQSKRAKGAIDSIEEVASKVEENSGLVNENTRKVASSSQEMVSSMESVKKFNRDSSQASEETAAAIDNVAQTSAKIVKRIDSFKVN